MFEYLILSIHTLTLIRRLAKLGLWPPERPSVSKMQKGWYFRHQPHEKAPELRMSPDGGYLKQHPEEPYGETIPTYAIVVPLV
jgi:hypothetical protein